MKKIITILTIILLLTAVSFAKAPDKTHLQFVTAEYNSYIGRHVFIETLDSAYLYQGRCLAISNEIITIRYIMGGVQVLTIPMHQVKRFYRMGR